MKIRCWTLCTRCGAESAGSEKEFDYVYDMEEAGHRLRPAIGICPDCSKDIESDESGLTIN